MKKYTFIFILAIIAIVLSFFAIKKANRVKVPLVADKPIKVNRETEEVELKSEIKSKINFEASFPDELREETSAFLKEFYDLYFLSLKELKYHAEIEDLFEDKEKAYIFKTALELLIENRLKENVDLKIDDISYELDLKNYKEYDDRFAIEVRETCGYRFNFTKEYLSKVYNIENHFDLKNVDGKLKIVYHKKVQDFYVMITDYYKKTDDYVTTLEKIKSDYEKTFTKENAKIKEMEQKYLNNDYTLLTCDNPYNREKAYEYATTWVGKRNNNWHISETSNCVNFVSQVMNAGGIPMDYYGNYQWKYYNYTKNTKNTPSGFVTSWTYVPHLVEYFQKNTGFGLCGKYNENIYLGEAGDVVVVGSKGPTRHVVSVIGQIKNSDGEVIDLLVNSNTVDLEYFPLKAYAYPYKVLMKVYGWNDLEE